MLKVIKDRMIMLVFVVFGVSLITFLISNVIPGDPARMIVGQRASQETYQSIREQLGLNDPLIIQYFNYVKGLFTGDLGTSIRTQQPVLEDILSYLPATLELIIIAFMIAIFFGMIIGVFTGIYNNTMIDYIGRIFSISGVSTPIFLSGLIVIIIFYGQLDWLPSSGRLDLTMARPPTVTGFYTVDSLMVGNLETFRNAVSHIFLPALILSYVLLSTVTRQVRSSMIDVLNKEYIRTANANGLSKWTVNVRYALRNSLIPTITVIGVSFGSLLGGAVVTEIVFNWPGMGKYVVDSIGSLDFPAIMGFTIVIAIGYVLINLIVDLLYIFLDPQIRE
ncbi:ABC transporter permease [Virgibacillus litoralis]|uniref:Peptide/nickel transport system permease protein n=1 Tax=Virgibacillus litoralis TaxID=578221 RepID=A0ABS4HBR1_9BACI|nr:ABC transporter permease [Virgibacillus litoralis]MBP1948331.1 peptide/nickel transport system permease protein [Virgibacillus litoralis]